MKKEEFVNRLAGIVYNIEIIDDSYRESTREAVDDGWDRGNTTTSHSIVGFRAAPETDNKYYDLAVPFDPKDDVTYYVLYAVYSTGDSFGHDDGSNVEYIGFYTEDELPIANENRRKVEGSTKENDNWSVELKTPNGLKTFDQHTPWVGYFEHLDYVDIASIERDRDENEWTKWQPIATAPTNGEMIVTMWKDSTVFAAKFDPEGWRVVMLGRDGEYGIHGNYAPFEPEHWLPHTDKQITLNTVEVE